MRTNALVYSILLFVAAALSVIVGLLLPVHISVLGTEGSCGFPVVTFGKSPNPDSELDQSLAQECAQQSKERAILGLSAATVLVLGGGALLAARNRPS